MRITVIGMGYVGLTTAAVLAHQGHPTTCTNLSASKVNNLRRGIPPLL